MFDVTSISVREKHKLHYIIIHRRVDYTVLIFGENVRHILNSDMLFVGSFE
jgi:hypothetical protein